MDKLKVACLWWLTIPHLLFWLLSKNKKVINEDIDNWGRNLGGGRFAKLIQLLICQQEFRNVFYLRIGFLKLFLLYLPRRTNLFINVKSQDFGAGTIIQHGFSTVITAEHIGRNCHINQQVTIGYNNSRTRGYGKPWIGDNVRISAGAKVCGPIKIGNNSVIGVNAVIMKDVPDNSVIIPSPMVVLYENGKRVNRKF